MRANMAHDPWDVVVLQGNSTEALKRAGGNFIQFNAYVGLLQRFITVREEFSYRDRDFYPGTTNAERTAACVAATGATTTVACNTVRNIPENQKANPQAAIHLYQTWARPDLTYPADQAYSGEPLENMTADVAEAYAQAALLNAGISAVVPVGEAFMRAVQTGVATRNPYDPEPRQLDLWWQEDQFHSSVYGSYLSALVMFGALTGVDPASFGANERAAGDLGIAARDALTLQRVASAQLTHSGYRLDVRPCLRSHPSSMAATVFRAQ